MKFTFTTVALSTAAIIACSTMNGVQAVLSPAVTCCSDNGGTYDIVNGGESGQSGICVKDGINTEAMVFMQQNCPTTPEPTSYTYKVYAVNSCDATVKADFNNLNNDDSGTPSNVTVAQGACAYVGPTNQDTVTYTSTGSFVSGGNDSCHNIGSSHNSDCNLMGMAANACVINLC